VNIGRSTGSVTERLQVGRNAISRTAFSLSKTCLHQN